MPPFVEGFLHGAWKDAPNLIQILIRERARDAETAPFSLWVQPFLIVRAMNPHTWFELIPHNLIEEATIAQKTLCKYCLDTHCLEKARPPVLHKRFHQDCQAEDNHSNMIRPGPDIMRPISYEYLYFRNSIATQTLERFLRSNSARFYQDWKCQQHVTHVDAEIAVGKRNDFLSIRFWCGANLWATVRNSDAPEQLLKILGIQYPMARGICYKLIVPAVGQDKGNRGTAFKEGVKIHCIHGRSTYHLKEPDNVQI